MPKKLGTLVVIVIQAKNLPNKQRIGKQDPRCVISYGSERQRTRVDEKGGQHPHWDDEFRFEIWEDLEDEIAKTVTPSGGIQPDYSTDGKDKKSKVLGVAVYADDPKDPKLIGEATIDISETLKKGEFDEWVTLTNKQRYVGEVFIEMTFYSAQPRPQPRKSHGNTPNDSFEFPTPSVPGKSQSSSSPSTTSTATSAAATASSLTNVPSLLRPGRRPVRASGANRNSTTSSSGNISYNSHKSSSSLSDRPTTPANDFGVYNPPYASSSAGGSSSQRDSYPQLSVDTSVSGGYNNSISQASSYSAIDDSLSRPFSALSVNKPLPLPGSGNQEEDQQPQQHTRWENRRHSVLPSSISLDQLPSTTQSHHRSESATLANSLSYAQQKQQQTQQQQTSFHSHHHSYDSPGFQNKFNDSQQSQPFHPSHSQDLNSSAMNSINNTSNYPPSAAPRPLPEPRYQPSPVQQPQQPSSRPSIPPTHSTLSSSDSQQHHYYGHNDLAPPAPSAPYEQQQQQQSPAMNGRLSSPAPIHNMNLGSAVRPQSPQPPLNHMPHQQQHIQSLPPRSTTPLPVPPTTNAMDRPASVNSFRPVTPSVGPGAYQQQQQQQQTPQSHHPGYPNSGPPPPMQQQNITHPLPALQNPSEPVNTYQSPPNVGYQPQPQHLHQSYQQAPSLQPSSPPHVPGVPVSSIQGGFSQAVATTSSPATFSPVYQQTHTPNQSSDPSPPPYVPFAQADEAQQAAGIGGNSRPLPIPSSQSYPLSNSFDHPPPPQQQQQQYQMNPQANTTPSSITQSSQPPPPQQHSFPPPPQHPSLPQTPQPLPMQQQQNGSFPPPPQHPAVNSGYRASVTQSQQPPAVTSSMPPQQQQQYPAPSSATNTNHAQLNTSVTQQQQHVPFLPLQQSNQQAHQPPPPFQLQKQHSLHNHMASPASPVASAPPPMIHQAPSYPTPQQTQPMNSAPPPPVPLQQSQPHPPQPMNSLPPLPSMTPAPQQQQHQMTSSFPPPSTMTPAPHQQPATTQPPPSINPALPPHPHMMGPPNQQMNIPPPHSMTPAPQHPPPQPQQQQQQQQYMSPFPPPSSIPPASSFPPPQTMAPSNAPQRMNSLSSSSSPIPLSMTPAPSIPPQMQPQQQQQPPPLPQHMMMQHPPPPPPPGGFSGQPQPSFPPPPHGFPHPFSPPPMHHHHQQQQQPPHPPQQFVPNNNVMSPPPPFSPPPMHHQQQQQQPMGFPRPAFPGQQQQQPWGGGNQSLSGPPPPPPRPATTAPVQSNSQPAGIGGFFVPNQQRY